MNKKILFICAGDHFDVTNRYSAIATVIVSMAELLYEKGYTVFVNNTDFKDIIQQVNKKEFSKSTRVDSVKKNPLLKFIPGVVKQALKELLNQRRLSQFYEETKKQEKADVVIEMLTYGSSVGCDLSKRWNCPFISIYDSPLQIDLLFLNNRKPIFNFIKKNEIKSVLNSNKVFVYSEAIADYIRENISKNSSFFIHQLVDFKRLEFLPSKPVTNPIHIGLICSFLKWHRVDLMIDVYSDLRAEGFDFKLILMGGGMDYDEIYNYAESTKYGNEIEFTNYIHGDRLKSYMQKIHIGVIANAMWYHAPMKLFQYGAANIVCVAPKTLAIKEICDGNDGGVLFEQNNIEDFRNRLRELIQNPDRISDLAQKNQNFIRKKYNPEVTFIKYEKLLNEVMNKA